MKVVRFAVLGLVAFGVVACTMAMLRVAELVPPPRRLALYPAWTAIHFAASLAFAVLLPLQLWPALRAARPRVHRITGRVAVAIGGVMATSGLAMAWLIADRTVSEQIFMSVFFGAWTVLLGLGLRAALARNIAAHRAWMARMTATTLTPLTQRLILSVFAVTFGVDDMATFWQLFVSAAWIGWGINLVVAEAWLQGRASPRLAAA